MSRYPAERVGLFVAAALTLSVAGCGRDEKAALANTVTSYIGAVQEQNIPALWSLRARQKNEKADGTPSAEFEEEASGYFTDYELGKRAGRIRFDSWGISLVQALALGRGNRYATTSIESPREDARFVVVHVPLPYETLDYNLFPKETTFYFLEKPLGKVFKRTLGRSDPRLQRELLSEISLRWALVAEKTNFPLSPKGWLVLAVTVVPEGVRYKEMDFFIGQTTTAP